MGVLLSQESAKIGDNSPPPGAADDDVLSKESTPKCLKLAHPPRTKAPTVRRMYTRMTMPDVLGPPRGEVL
jgi:hypothetical protein